MERLPPEVPTLYAELLEHLTTTHARHSIGQLSGSFVEKRIKDAPYLYFQHSVPGGSVRQIYLGRRTPQLEAFVRRFAENREHDDSERAHAERLCAELRAGGAAATEAASARVLGALADAGVFHAGGVLVGTHAFVVLGNMLGVRWGHALLRTEDIDIASASVLEIAVPDLRADIPSVLASLEMGFLPVPGLSPKTPSTSFKVRGRRLRVDLLTPLSGRPRGPVFIPRFRAAAEPLPFLDYLLEDAQDAAIVDGRGILVRVPHPARFALHKLIVAPVRPAALQSKSDKDLHQAAEIVRSLASDRPGDLRLAHAAIAKRGPRWVGKLGSGVKLLTRRHPDAAELLSAELAPRRRPAQRR